MADAHAKHHDYHLVNPSPWPAVGAAARLYPGGRRGHVDAWRPIGRHGHGLGARSLHHVHVVARCHQGGHKRRPHAGRVSFTCATA